MEPKYLIDAEEFYKRIENAQISNPKDKNCTGNSFYLSGLIKKEIRASTIKKEITNLIMSCDEKEAIFISFEKKGKGQREIKHILTIDPKDRNVVYSRNGVGGIFWMVEKSKMVRLCLKELSSAEMKYSKLNLEAVGELIKDR
mgnify:CR=1 FL=1